MNTTDIDIVARVKELFLNGENTKSISKKIGLSQTTVCKYVKQIRKPKETVAEKSEKITRFYDNGANITQTCKHFKISIEKFYEFYDPTLKTKDAQIRQYRKKHASMQPGFTNFVSNICKEWSNRNDRNSLEA